MKKTAAMLLALLLILNACAFAFNGANYPAWDGSSGPENSLCGSFSGENIALEFDPAGEFSGMQNGTLQACFFAFDAAEKNYLEMYLQLQADLSAGDVFSSGTPNVLTSVTLYEVAETSEDLYYAGQIMGFAYPEGSSYEICIDEVQRSAGSIAVRGTLSALLYAFDEDNRLTGETLQLQNARFHFDLPLNDAKLPSAPDKTAVPEGTAAPESTEMPLPTFPQLPMATPTPRHTMDPHPAFTLPPDYRVI